MAAIYQPTAFSKLTEGAEKGVEFASALKNAEIERTIAEMQDVADYGVISPYATKYMKMFDGLSKSEASNLRKAILDQLPEMPSVNVLTYFGRVLGEKLLSRAAEDRLRYLQMYMGSKQELPDYDKLAEEKIYAAARQFNYDKIFQDKKAGQLIFPIASATALKMTGASTFPELNEIYKLFLDDLSPSRGKEWGKYTGAQYIDEAELQEKLNNYAMLLYKQTGNESQLRQALIGNAIFAKTIASTKNLLNDIRGFIGSDKTLKNIVTDAYPIMVDDTIRNRAFENLNNIYNVPLKFMPAKNEGAGIDLSKILEKGKELLSETGGMLVPPGQPQPNPSSYIGYKTQQIAPPLPTNIPQASSNIPPVPVSVPKSTLTPEINRPVVPSFTPTPTPIAPTPQQNITPVKQPLAKKISVSSLSRAQTSQAKGASKVAKRDYFSEMLENYNNIPSGVDIYKKLKSSLGV
ncbi:MAG: hypothetical protein ACUVQP_03655 [Bacteroidales bacterium]